MVSVVVGWLTLFLFLFNLAVLGKIQHDRGGAAPWSMWFITTVSFGAGLYIGAGILW